MIAYYRLTDIPSTNSSPIHQEDKFALNKLCLELFRDAYRGVSPKVVFIADYCGEEYDEMIKRIIPFDYEIRHTELGINGTCLLQYQLAREQDDDILFQECDYIYRPDTGQDLVNGLNALGLVSPYDHLNFYIDKTLHSSTADIYLVDDVHWRSSERNTMTFAVKNVIFKDNYNIFYKYGYLDGDVWYDLRDAGQRLFVPIPSLATHMVADYLAPSIDWKELYEPES